MCVCVYFVFSVPNISVFWIRRNCTQTRFLSLWLTRKIICWFGKACSRITKAIPVDTDVIPEDPVRAEWGRLEGKFTHHLCSSTWSFTIESEVYLAFVIGNWDTIGVKIAQLRSQLTLPSLNWVVKSNRRNRTFCSRIVSWSALAASEKNGCKDSEVMETMIYGGGCLRSSQCDLPRRSLYACAVERNRLLKYLEDRFFFKCLH